MISSDNPIYSNQSTDMLETISNNSIINNNDNHDNTNADKDALHLLIHKPKPPPRRSSSIIKVHLQEADRTIVPALEIFSDHTIGKCILYIYNHSESQYNIINFFIYCLFVCLSCN